MSFIFEYLATLFCAVFCGASIYINLVEHPARLSCGTEIAAKQWAPSYQRATVMQASLALLSLIFGLLAFVLSHSVIWLIAALMIGSVIPYTFAVMLPINKSLLAPDRDLASLETRALLEKWGRLHAVRSVLSAIAFIIYLYAAFQYDVYTIA